jgi:hypothetical protein
MGADLYTFLNKALEPRPGQRRGQWFANLLHTINPNLLNRLIKEDVDPFYDDAKLWAAVEYVKKNWNS